MQGWTVVFDLDGTLIDTAPDLAAATNHVMSTLALAPVDETEIRPFVGHGALAMIEGAARAHGRILRERELHDLFEVFILHYTANIADHSRPYPGVVAAMDRMTERGAKLAICTNKLEAHALALLSTLGLKDRFAAITGRDSLGAYKPDPRHLTGTIERAGGRADRALMIGDSETDILTAQRAAIPVIAVTFGYSIEPIATFGPDACIDHYDDLDAAIAKLVKTEATEQS